MKGIVIIGAILVILGLVGLAIPELPLRIPRMCNPGRPEGAGYRTDSTQHSATAQRRCDDSWGRAGGRRSLQKPLEYRVDRESDSVVGLEPSVTR
jgi:hypothetical protein